MRALRPSCVCLAAVLAAGWLYAAAAAPPAAGSGCAREKGLIRELLLESRRQHERWTRFEASEGARDDAARLQLENEGRKLQVDPGPDEDAAAPRLHDVKRLLAPMGPRGGGSAEGTRSLGRSLGEAAKVLKAYGRNSAVEFPEAVKTLVKECKQLHVGMDSIQKLANQKLQAKLKQVEERLEKSEAKAGTAKSYSNSTIGSEAKAVTAKSNSNSNIKPTGRGSLLRVCRTKYDFRGSKAYASACQQWEQVKRDCMSEEGLPWKKLGTCQQWKKHDLKLGAMCNQTGSKQQFFMLPTMHSDEKKNDPKYGDLPAKLQQNINEIVCLGRCKKSASGDCHCHDGRQIAVFASSSARTFFAQMENIILRLGLATQQVACEDVSHTGCNWCTYGFKPKQKETWLSEKAFKTYIKRQGYASKSTLEIDHDLNDSKFGEKKMSTFGECPGRWRTDSQKQCKASDETSVQADISTAMLGRSEAQTEKDEKESLRLVRTTSVTVVKWLYSLLKKALWGGSKAKRMMKDEGLSLAAEDRLNLGEGRWGRRRSKKKKGYLTKVVTKASKASGATHMAHRTGATGVAKGSMKALKMAAKAASGGGDKVSELAGQHAATLVLKVAFPVIDNVVNLVPCLTNHNKKLVKNVLKETAEGYARKGHSVVKTIKRLTTDPNGNFLKNLIPNIMLCIMARPEYVAANLWANKFFEPAFAYQSICQRMDLLNPVMGRPRFSLKKRLDRETVVPVLVSGEGEASFTGMNERMPDGKNKPAPKGNLHLIKHNIGETLPEDHDCNDTKPCNAAEFDAWEKKFTANKTTFYPILPRKFVLIFIRASDPWMHRYGMSYTDFHEGKEPKPWPYPADRPLMRFAWAECIQPFCASGYKNNIARVPVGVGKYKVVQCSWHKCCDEGGQANCKKRGLSVKCKTRLPSLAERVKQCSWHKCCEKGGQAYCEKIGLGERVNCNAKTPFQFTELTDDQLKQKKAFDSCKSKITKDGGMKCIGHNHAHKLVEKEEPMEAPLCAARAVLSLDLCNTCCCKSGAVSTNASMSLITGTRHKCGAWMAAADFGMRGIMSIARIFLIVDKFGDRC